MPIDPTKREGRGAFPKEGPSEPLDDRFTEATLNKAETRTVLFDYLHMLLIGFINALKGLLHVEGSTKSTDDKQEK